MSKNGLTKDELLDALDRIKADWHVPDCCHVVVNGRNDFDDLRVSLRNDTIILESDGHSIRLSQEMLQAAMDWVDFTKSTTV